MASTTAAPKPTTEQVATVASMIRDRPTAEMVAWMDDLVPGTMMLNVLDDGLCLTACFGRDGQIQGDWF